MQPKCKLYDAAANSQVGKKPIHLKLKQFKDSNQRNQKVKTKMDQKAKKLKANLYSMSGPQGLNVSLKSELLIFGSVI
jgi:hypothetical protein